jgi:hypothetical protein
VVFGRSTDWDRLARELGLERAEQGVRGRFAGLRVGAYESWEHAPRDHDDPHDDTKVYFAKIWASIEPELRMALRVRSESSVIRFFEAFGGGREKLGDPELDRAFDVWCPELAHARAVVVGARTALLAVRGWQKDLEIDDRTVVSNLPGWGHSFDTLRIGMEQCAQVASALRFARQRAPASWEPEVWRGFRALASSLGLAFDPHRAELRGVVRGLSATARVEVEGGAHTVVVTELPRPLGLGLSLAVRRLLLGAPAQRLLALLSRARDVAIQADTLVVSSQRVEVGELPAMMLQCAEAASLLAPRAW